MVGNVSKAVATLRYQRYYPDSPTDNRFDGQRDRDRILYTSAFRRLAGVTQVVSAHEGHVFHNRLTHSLEVAQLARRSAEKLLRDQPKVARALGGVDPDVAEAAALAHDIGHPPFGHIAEDELDRLLVDAGVKDGFNGNAQSFRIVTKLALRRAHHPGLNLTRATLNGILKYPWLRSSGGIKDKKWGAYLSEQDLLQWARSGYASGDETKSVEAELMDWADDVTYAVHDVEDFYRAGLIPLDRLATDARERTRLLAFAQGRYTGSASQWADIENAFNGLITFIPLREPYSSTRRIRAGLRSLTASLIARYIKAIRLHTPTTVGERRVEVDPELENEVWMWKQLPWFYVIRRAGLATQQYGQTKIIRRLFEIFCDAAINARELSIFPAGFGEALQSARKKRTDFDIECRRIVVDLIAGMAEREAVLMYNRLEGVSPGSALDFIGR